MLRTTLPRLAAHAARQPSIHFPDRSHKPSHHEPGPHPAAPSSIADSFTQFQEKRKSSAADVALTDAPLAGPAGGAGHGKGFDSSMPQAAFEEWELPERLSRSKLAPTDAEIDAVLSGGATLTADVTRKTKEQWYYAQV